MSLFHKICAINHYSICAVAKNVASLEMLKEYYFIITLPHAHF